MRKLPMTLLSIAYWYGALSFLGLVVIVHGECFADAACTAQKRAIALAGLALAAIGYAMFIRVLRRRSRRSDR